MAEHDHLFDALCKKVAIGISRRSLLGAASFAVAGWLSPWLKNLAFAQEPAKQSVKAGKSEFHKYHESSEWKCNSLKQVKLLHGSNGKTNYALDVCIYNVRCDKVNGAKEDPRKFLAVCKLTGELCLDLPECAMEQQEYDENDIRWDDGLQSANPIPAPANVAKFGQNCAYDTTDNISKLVFRRRLDVPEKSDPLCTTPIKDCATTIWLAACRPDGIQRIDGKIRLSCPVPQDCLAKPIESTPALTKSEAAKR